MASGLVPNTSNTLFISIWISQVLRMTLVSSVVKTAFFRLSSVVIKRFLMGLMTAQQR